jgi:hypothetical protein
VFAGLADFGTDQLIIFNSKISYAVGTWHLKRFTSTEVIKKSSGGHNSTQVIGRLYFNRDTKKFYRNTFLVDFLLNMAIWVSFWIPPNAAPARVSLVIISFLSFRILMNELDRDIPPVIYAVWVIDYMSLSQLMAGLALLQFALLSWIVHAEANREAFFGSLSRSNLKKLFYPAEGSEDHHDEEFEKNMFDRADALYKELHRIEVVVTSPIPKRHNTTSKSAVKTMRDDDDDKASIELNKKGAASNSSVSGEVTVVDIDMRGTSLDDPVPKDENFVMGDVREREMSVGDSHSKSPLPPLPSKSSKLKNNTDAIVNKSNSSHSSLSLIGDITIDDAITLHRIHNIFHTADFHLGGTISIMELKLLLRGFGRYYSTLQLCALVHKFRQTFSGSSLEEEPELNLKDFAKFLLFLIDAVPVADTTKSIFEEKPSHLLDLFSRVFYIILYGLKIVVMFTILDTYNNESE